MRFRPAAGASVPTLGKENATPRKRTIVLMDETLQSKDAFFMKSKQPAKRKKPLMEVRYPRDIPIPSVQLVQSLYTVSITMDGSHQAALDSLGSGLLSLEEVLLPVVARVETNAIKKIQAQAQRDTPGAVRALKQSRLAILESTSRAAAMAKEARQLREMREHETEKDSAEQKRKAKEETRRQRREEKRRQKEIRAQAAAEEKTSLKHEKKKKLPKNMEKWREVAFLMTELAKIKKEKKMWNEVGLYLAEQEKGVISLEEKLGSEPTEDDTETGEPNAEAKKYDERLFQAVESLSLSSRRIGRSMEAVSRSVDQCEKERKDLFQTYKNDHMFYGYRGVKNPKSLVIALSQET